MRTKHMKITIVFISFYMFSMSTSIAQVNPFEAQYIFATIDAPSSSTTIVTGINDAGHILGYYVQDSDDVASISGIENSLDQKLSNVWDALDAANADREKMQQIY